MDGRAPAACARGLAAARDARQSQRMGQSCPLPAARCPLPAARCPLPAPLPCIHPPSALGVCSVSSPASALLHSLSGARGPPATVHPTLRAVVNNPTLRRPWLWLCRKSARQRSTSWQLVPPATVPRAVADCEGRPRASSPVSRLPSRTFPPAACVPLTSHLWHFFSKTSSSPFTLLVVSLTSSLISYRH